MGRRLVLPAVEVLVGLVLLACASGGSRGPGIYWSEFAAIESNFQDYFDERRRDLHQIEGIWSAETSSRGQFAILRDRSYAEYDYVVVRVLQAGQGRGEIVAALRSAGLDLPIYEYACTDALRGEPCRTFPCSGTITLVRNELWGDRKDCFCGFCAAYWIKRFPSQ